jgi:hypothetical protein
VEVVELMVMKVMMVEVEVGAPPPSLLTFEAALAQHISHSPYANSLANNYACSTTLQRYHATRVLRFAAQQQQ